MLCTERSEGDAASRRNTLYLALPANAKGVSVVGDWDPLGMRGTVSRTLIFKDVFVPEDEMLMPRGVYFRAATSWPHMFLTLSPTYMGLAQAAYDFTVAYLRGELPGTPPVKRRMYPTKQIAVAEMRIMLEQTKALWFQAVSEARANPTQEQVLRAYAAQFTVMENANALAAKAIRTCGGQAMLKNLALERIYRDSRCGSLMLPWTAEICLDRLGRESLYAAGRDGRVKYPALQQRRPGAARPFDPACRTTRLSAAVPATGMGMPVGGLRRAASRLMQPMGITKLQGENRMTKLDRRSVLTGAAASRRRPPSAPMATPRAKAAAPPAGTQNAGWYRYKVGSHEVTVVTDGANRFKFPDSFVANKSRDEVNEGLAAAFLQPAPDMIAVPYSPIVVNTGGKLVVIDTGTGEANFERSKGAAGQFHGNLKAAGIDRNQVDTVIISHFHGDHINGLLTPDNKPSFPNAEILVPAAEWKYFMDDAEMGKQTSDRMKGVFAGLRRVFDALGRKVTPYEPDKEVAPGITSVATYGHTPGHNSFIIASGNSKVFVQADVTNLPAVRAQSGLAPDVRPGRRHGGGHAAQGLRHAGRREDDGAGLPLSFPRSRLYRKTSTGYRETMVPWSPTL